MKPIEDDFEKRRLNYLAYSRATATGRLTRSPFR